jgi:hypothetical protein
MKTSVRIVGVPAEFRTRHRLNASQKRRLSRLACWNGFAIRGEARRQTFEKVQSE